MGSLTARLGKLEGVARADADRRFNQACQALLATMAPEHLEAAAALTDHLDARAAGGDVKAQRALQRASGERMVAGGRR